MFEHFFIHFHKNVIHLKNENNVNGNKKIFAMENDNLNYIEKKFNNILKC
jgi:hypothetical protein